VFGAKRADRGQTLSCWAAAGVQRERHSAGACASFFLPSAYLATAILCEMYGVPAALVPATTLREHLSPCGRGAVAAADAYPPAAGAGLFMPHSLLLCTPFRVRTTCSSPQAPLGRRNSVAAAFLV
jgi:hypothetical protein